MHYGFLPAVWNLDSAEERNDFLRTYAYAYIKEEVWAEQLVRKLPPFRKFLQLAAQMSGKILNYSAIARQI